MTKYCLDNENTSGVYNAVSPSPSSNNELTKAIGSAINRPTMLPAPGFGLKLILGEFAESLLASVRVSPSRIQRDGFEFKHTDLKQSVIDLIG